jgi:hypothetical protein
MHNMRFPLFRIRRKKKKAMNVFIALIYLEKKIKLVNNISCLKIGFLFMKYLF